MLTRTSPARWRIALLAPLLGLALACSSSRVVLGPRPPDHPEILGPVEGSACGVIMGPRLAFVGVSVIPIMLDGRFERAYEEALGDEGEGLLETRIRERRYPLVFGQLLCVDIEGVAYRAGER